MTDCPDGLSPGGLISANLLGLTRPPKKCVGGGEEFMNEMGNHFVGIYKAICPVHLLLVRYNKKKSRILCLHSLLGGEFSDCE